MRKLIDGTEASELNEPISLIVKTKCPKKAFNSNLNNILEKAFLE